MEQKKPNKPSARQSYPPDYAGRCCRPISTGPDNKAIKQPRCSPSLDVYLTSTHSYKPVGAGHSNKDSRRAHFSDTRRGPAGGDCRPFVSRVPAAASAYFFFIDMISCSTVFFLLDFPSLLSLHLVVAPPSFPRSCRLHLWPALACLELAGRTLSWAFFFASASFFVVYFLFPQRPIGLFGITFAPTSAARRNCVVPDQISRVKIVLRGCLMNE